MRAIVSGIVVTAFLLLYALPPAQVEIAAPRAPESPTIEIQRHELAIAYIRAELALDLAEFPQDADLLREAAALQIALHQDHIRSLR